MAFKLQPLGSVSFNLVENIPNGYWPSYVVVDKSNSTFYVLSGAFVAPVTYTPDIKAGPAFSLAEAHKVIAVDPSTHLIYGGTPCGNMSTYTSSWGKASYGITIYDPAQGFKKVGYFDLGRLQITSYPCEVLSLAIYKNILIVGTDAVVPIDEYNAPQPGIIYLIDLSDPVNKITAMSNHQSRGPGIRNFSICNNRVYSVNFNSSNLIYFDLDKPSVQSIDVVPWSAEGPLADGVAIDPANHKLYVALTATHDTTATLKTFDIQGDVPTPANTISIPGSCFGAIDIDTVSRLIYACDPLRNLLSVVNTTDDQVIGPIQPPAKSTDSKTLFSLAVDETNHVVCVVSADENKVFLYQQGETTALEDLQAELDALKQQFDAQKTQIDAQKTQIDALKAQIDALKAQIDALKAQFDDAIAQQVQRALLERKIQKIQAEQAKLAAKEAELKAKLDGSTPDKPKD